MPSVSDLALGKENFLFLKYFAECPWDGTRQRFNFFYYFFAECSCGCTRQRGNFLKNFKTLFAECLIPGTRQRHHFPSATPRHSAKFFFFFCFWRPIFLCSPFKAPGTPSYNLGIFCGFLLYLVTLFRLLEFFPEIRNLNCTWYE